MTRTIALVALLLFSCSVLRAELAGPEAPTVVFKNSVLPVSPEAVKAAKESAEGENFGFMVTLKMRNKEQLRARLDKGETISMEEMEEKYLPLESDYKAVVKYFKDAGLHVDDGNRRSRLSIGVWGTVKQVKNVLSIEMRDFTFDGTTYHWAVNAPSLPASMAAPILGIIGLQNRKLSH